MTEIIHIGEEVWRIRVEIQLPPQAEYVTETIFTKHNFLHKLCRNSYNKFNENQGNIQSLMLGDRRKDWRTDMFYT